MLNRITAMGRLTREPELRYTQSGVPVCTVTLAVERDFAGPDGQRQADFIDVVAWRQTAEFISKYFQKGRMMYADGRLQSRDWTDKTGQKRRSWEIIAETVGFCGDRAPAAQAAPEIPDYHYPGGDTFPRQEAASQTPAQMPISDFDALDDDPDKVPF